MLTLLASVALAVDLHVPADYPTIEDALDQSTGYYDFVVVAPGTYEENVVIDQPSVIILAPGAVWKPVSGSADPVVRVQPSVSLTLVGGHLEGDGSGIGILNRGSLQVIGAELSGFGDTYGSDAAIVDSGDDLTLNSVWFHDNEGGDGAAVQSIGSNHVDVAVSRFERNMGSGLGGALYVENGSSVDVDGSWFDGNEASQGGAAYVVGTGVDFDSNQFYGNVADDGGALALVNSLVTTDEDLFCGNTADAGGAAWVSGGSAVFVDATVVGHSANDGAGLHVLDPASVTVDSALFAYNGPGAAVDSDSSFVTQVIEPLFWLNSTQALGNVSVTYSLYVDPLFTGYPADCSIDALRTFAPAGAFAGGLSVDGDGDGWSGDVDCDDSDPTVYPTAPEAIGDNVDSNCDIVHYCYLDGDGDGASDPDRVAYVITYSGASSCAASGLLDATAPVDCDDTDSGVRPGAVEIPGDGIDQDCDGTELCYLDGDGDGARSETTFTSDDTDCDDADEALASAPIDCDDADGARAPTLAEVAADGIDQDCNGQELCYFDEDDDTYGTRAGITLQSSDFSCTKGGLSPTADDCDDIDPLVNPGAKEVAGDGVDSDCDGFEVCYLDGDGDGFGGNTPQDSTNLKCTDKGQTLITGDCDDSLPDVNPAAKEVPCNGVDEDCLDGDDDGGDGDGDGAPACLDCDDADPDAAPGNAEVACNGIDDDCDDTTADAPDADGDGVGVCDDDCDDADPARTPGADEVACNGIDDDCDDTTPDCDGSTDPTTGTTGTGKQAPAPTPPDYGCGCQAVESPAGGLALALGLVGLWRRRRRAR